MRLILASASPRRAELLTLAGYRFEVLSADIDEGVRPGEAAEDYVQRLATEKARAVLDRTKAQGDDVLVLGADTTVVVENEILGKPEDDQDSARMVRLLAGRPHRVLTGVSLCSRWLQLDAVDETLVFFQPMTEQEVAWYVASGEGRDKAGAYAIQGLASRFIPRIDGSHSNVVGLPVAVVAELVGRAESRLRFLASSR
ncbi:MAG: Maf family protein [Vicinamibacterales bacterium]